MEAKHTPGPWVALWVGDLKATLIGTADRSTAFARMEANDGTPDEETQEANARLIAAAPELLEAVKLYFDATDLLADGPDDSDEEHALGMIHRAQGIARAAIAKAEAALSPTPQDERA